jgi:hypothetical protein
MLEHLRRLVDRDGVVAARDELTRHAPGAQPSSSTEAGGVTARATNPPSLRSGRRL